MPSESPACETVELQIRRQDGPTTKPYWQTFVCPVRPGANVVSLLMDLREHCVTQDGTRVDPVAFEHNCMEEVCGACAMLINGSPRPACSALIAELEAPIRLEPLPKFPVVRDLMVDRAALFAHLKRVKAWIKLDGPWDVHERAPRVSPKEWQANYLYSRCMSCGCCMAACPQFGPQFGSQFGPEASFVGPAPLAQVRLMNAHPTGRYDKAERLHAIMADGGLSDCGNAQNCVRVCPKAIPLTTAIGELGRETTLQAFKDLFGPH
ncbi:succinate dehydrogenase iron-sulfur subunit [Halochromatium glycolicum]|uniref:succinate dehydrogenase n=1 Tax=Halochromatium glycolicum TaxID=85075 RepID=A0AAJ0U6N9_9GAMM|nr:succinate dehydrogenase iron-sulfur subunit [Halochromatium glycolicum]MBK1706168.1 succinate dehydrogenase iron-sulfur subunit [Halochromatium glycolicum]